VLNLCQPDDKKSCVACCGLYNVPDATRETLHAKLERRTRLFADTDRSVQSLIEFESFISKKETNKPLVDTIHVCEFVGFVDQRHRKPGCMLHPNAPGNAGIDLRGLCHYGSLACKTFYCPACESIDPVLGQLLIDLVDDWHLYGLVITDLDFVNSLFYLLRSRVGDQLEDVMGSARSRSIALKEMLSWKDAWPFHKSSHFRRSRYFYKESVNRYEAQPNTVLSALLDIIEYTFDEQGDRAAEEEYVHRSLDRFESSLSFPVGE
jgi:hypothetical protein